MIFDSHVHDCYVVVKQFHLLYQQMEPDHSIGQCKPQGVYCN